MSIVDRVPPASLEAEMAALGCALQSYDALAIVERLCVPSDFYAHAHETIAASIFELYADRKPVDKISVAETLRVKGRLEKVGGLPYLTSLLDVLATESSAEYYATLVREKAQLRKLIGAGAKICELGFGGEEDVSGTVSAADATLREAIYAGQTEPGGTSASMAMRKSFRDLEAACAGTNDARCVMSPWPRMNEMIGGFFPGELIVIASAPAQGKTGVVLDLADYIGERYGGVAFFTLEMPVIAISRRWIALHSGISARSQRLGDIRDSDWGRISAAMETISKRGVRLFGRDEASSIAAIRRELSFLAREAPTRAIVVDHVNFLDDANASAGRDRMTKHERLDLAYQKLLSLASEYQVIVFAVQHVNRKGMGARPTLETLRDGGNLEGHASAVIFPYRPDPDHSDPAQRAKGEFILAKTRDGEEGTIPMRLLGWRHLWLQDDGTEFAWFESAGARFHGAA